MRGHLYHLSAAGQGLLSDFWQLFPGQGLEKLPGRLPPPHLMQMAVHSPLFVPVFFSPLRVKKNSL